MSTSFNDPRNAPDPKINRAYSVPCPMCEVGPGVRCFYKRGMIRFNMVGYTHLSREQAAANEELHQGEVAHENRA